MLHKYIKIIKKGELFYKIFLFSTCQVILFQSMIDVFYKSELFVILEKCKILGPLDKINIHLDEHAFYKMYLFLFFFFFIKQFKYSIMKLIGN